jgi:uncharacterized coiled-coil protein SlyX
MPTKKTTSRRSATKPAKKTTKPRTTRRRVKATKPFAEKPEAQHALDPLREQLKKLGDKLHEQKEHIPHLSDKTHEHLDKFGDTLHEAKDKGVHIAHDVSDSMRKGFQKLGDTLSDAKNKGVHAIKEVAEKIRLFAHDSTELTKLKIELHNLRKEKEKLFMLMGEQLANLYKSHDLSQIENKFTYDFKRLDELETTIAEKEKDSEKFSTDLKAIK